VNTRQYIYRGFKAALGRSYVRIKGGNREISWLLWEVILPLLMIASVVYTYRSMNAPSEFIGFVILGGAMMSFWFNVLWGMGSTLYWEKEKGNLEVLLASGAPLYGLLLGMALGGMFNTAVRAASVIIIGVYIFEASFNPATLPVAIIIFFLAMAALYSLGLSLASIYLMYSRSGWRASELLSEPIMFISGMYYPLSVFPIALQVVASAFPLAIGLDGIRRSLIYGETFGSLAVHMILLVVMAIILLRIGLWALEYMENKAKKEGRLILRWM